MQERTEAIRKSLDEAQAARAEAQRERESHAAKIQAAHAEAQAIRAAALKEAAEEQRRLVEAARGEAARLVESAKAELAAGRPPGEPGTAPGGERSRDHRGRAAYQEEPARRGSPSNRRGRDRAHARGALSARARGDGEALRQGALRGGAGGGPDRRDGTELEAFQDVLVEHTEVTDVLSRPWVKPADRRGIAVPVAEKSGAGQPRSELRGSRRRARAHGSSPGDRLRVPRASRRGSGSGPRARAHR